MWIVVSFDDDNTVECVPNFWYKNNACAWSNKTVENHTKMIELCYNPNNLKFDFFIARILSKNIGTYYKLLFKYYLYLLKIII